jgi:dUTP pyrophosphatase
MKLIFTKLHPDAVTPSKAYPTDSGYDLTAVEVENTGTQLICKTGIAVRPPDGYACYIFPRSSIRKTGLVMANSVGVIDATYTGGLEVSFIIFSPNNLYKVGDRVAQLVVLPLVLCSYTVTTELPEQTADKVRGNNGFGSTGN